MRVFACSDVHVDFEYNLRRVNRLSNSDFQNDILILAGDVTDNIILFQKVLEDLRNRFSHLVYIPGNHDLWVRYDLGMSSFDKMQRTVPGSGHLVVGKANPQTRLNDARLWT